MGQLSNSQKGGIHSSHLQMHYLPRRLEEKHQHAAKVLDNKESAFWEETVGQEKAKRMAGQGLGRSIDLLSPCLCGVRFIPHGKHRWNPSVIEFLLMR